MQSVFLYTPTIKPCCHTTTTPYIMLSCFAPPCSHTTLLQALQQQGRACRAVLAAAACSGSTQALLHPVVYHPDFQISPIPNDHRFPMPKDHLLYVALQQEGLAVPPPQDQKQPTQLAEAPLSTTTSSSSSSSSPRSNVFTPSYPDEATLCLVHDKAYVDAFLSGSISAAELRRIGLPWSQQLVQRTLVGTGSAVLAARLALSFGIGIMCNGGTHHAHKAHGSGWCIFNDLAVAAKAAQRDAGVGQVLMLDLDVHQGDGSATIFAGDPSVFTFSVHCGDQTFPMVVQQSSWDIALRAGTGDEEYLQVLQEALPRLFDRVQPELCLYNAGVDVHKEDQLGLLALTNDGIASRDRAVFDACLNAGVPLAAAIGGGYQKDHSHIVERHMHLHRAAADFMPRFAEMMQAKRRARASARPVAQSAV